MDLNNEPANEIKQPVSQQSDSDKVLFFTMSILVAGVFLVFGLFARNQFISLINRNKAITPKTPTAIYTHTAPVSSIGNQIDTCKSLTNYKNTSKLNISGKKTISELADQQLLTILAGNYDGLLYGISPLSTNSTKVDLADSELGRVAISSFGYKVAYVVIKGNQTGIVYLADLKDQTIAKIYEDKIIAGDSSGDYFLGLKDVGISADGTLVAITTATQIFTYDTETKTLVKQYEIEPKKPKTFGIYGFYSPKILDTSNRYLMFTAGHYEGSNDSVIDLKTKKPLDVSYGSYVVGANIIGFYNNKLVVNHYGNNNYATDTQKDGIFLVDPYAPKSETLQLDTNEIVPNTGLEIIKNIRNKIYYSVNEPSENNQNASYCDNNKTPKPIKTMNLKIYSYDMAKKTTATLLNLDVTSLQEYGQYIPLDKIDSMWKFISLGEYEIEGKNRLLILLNNGGSVVFYEVVNPETFELTQLVF